MIDAIIVGGGPAGLSAALILGRSKRVVVVCDAGEPRNALSNAVHGFFSRDGIPPRELQCLAKEQLGPYGVEIRAAAVTKAARYNEIFEVGVQQGEALWCRKLLLAPGVVDQLPSVEGLAQLWGSSVFNCPYCHAWEVRDQPLGVYGKATEALELALLLTAWTSDLILLSDGPADFSPDQRRILATNNIGLHEERIIRLRERAGQLEAIELEDGTFMSRRAMFLRTTLRYRNELAKQLGCALAQTGAIVVDNRGQTSVRGVYAAGDCTGGPGQALGMAAEGARAAFAINRDLVEEDLVK